MIRKLDTKDTLAIGAHVLSAGMTAAVYTRLPDRIATHFDAHGTANGWMSRAEGAWFLPLFGFGMWVILRFAARVIPPIAPGNAAVSPMKAFATILAWFFAAIQVMILWVALAPGASIVRPLSVVLALLVLSFAAILPRTRRNALVGIRTPWTLTSDENWSRTHRVAGYSFAIAGVIALVCALVLPAALIPITALVVAAALVPAFYSLVIARKLPPSV